MSDAEAGGRTSSEDSTGGLVRLLDVEEIDTDLYRGVKRLGRTGEVLGGRVFGGQVVGQALMAAARSTDADRPIHSLHCYFMRPGDNALPIVYRVMRDHDGGSFSTRRIVAMQRGRPILNMAASFQKVEGGLTHQARMPDVPPPEDVPLQPQPSGRSTAADRDFARRLSLPPRAIELRSQYPLVGLPEGKQSPEHFLWFRTRGRLPDDPLIHQAVLGFVSDMGLLATAMLPHGLDLSNTAIQSASLDHALWFHEPFRCDEWLLYDMASPWSGHARGFNLGRIFSRDGRLVASAAQEGLLRLRQAAP